MNWEAWAEIQAIQITELRRDLKRAKERIRVLTAQRDRWRTYAIKGRPTWKRQSG
jgi:hypothetical protein